MIAMQNLKVNYIRRVVALFARSRYSEATERRVGVWLTNDNDRKVKEEALESLWTASLDEAETDDEGVDDAYERWVKNNLSALESSAETASNLERESVIEVPAARRRNILWIWQGVAAMLAVAVVSLAWLLVGRTSLDAYPSKMVQAFCPVGQTRDVTLPDGTKVLLNGGSSITYLERFAKDRRDVLLMGEANFKVTKDAARPFTVSTGDVDVTALGTEFNIKAYSDSHAVVATLLEGLVKVAYGIDVDDGTSSNTTLQPAQQLVFDRNERVADVKNVNLNDITAWQRGELVFDNVTLYEILDELENRFAHKFVYRLGTLPTDRYTFRFRKGMTLDEVMKVVEDVTGAVSCSIDDNTCKIYPNS